MCKEIHPQSTYVPVVKNMQNCRWAHRNTVNLIQGLVKVSKGAQGHTDNPFAQLCRVCWCTWGEGWAWKEVVVFIAVTCFWLCKLVCHFYHWVVYVWAGMGGGHVWLYSVTFVLLLAGWVGGDQRKNIGSAGEYVFLSLKVFGSCFYKLGTATWLLAATGLWGSSCIVHCTYLLTLARVILSQSLCVSG